MVGAVSIYLDAALGHGDAAAERSSREEIRDNCLHGDLRTAWAFVRNVIRTMYGDMYRHVPAGNVGLDSCRAAV